MKDLIFKKLFKNGKFNDRELQKHIHRVEYTEYEYYGNYTAQSFMYILHSDLLAVLKDLNNDQ